MTQRCNADDQRQQDQPHHISRQRINVLDLSATAEAFEITDAEALAQAEQREYTLPIFPPDGQAWQLPAGAFGKEGCGSL